MDSKLTQLKNTLGLRFYAFLKIPLLWWIQPTLLETSKTRTTLKIPLTRRTKNHLNVMYFGALAMGAEAAIAVKAVSAIQKSKRKVDFLFKDFQATFTKRADGDVHFICEQGFEVEALIQKAIESKQREAQTFQSYAVVPSNNPDQKIAEFHITMTVKCRD